MRNVFIETIKIDTQTVYHENGSVSVTPAVYEDGKHQVVAGGKTSVSQKGKLITDDDGRSKFLPYAAGSGSRYSRVSQVQHRTAIFW